MKIIQKVIEFEGRANKDFYLVPLGDIHVGNTGCDWARLKEIVDYIKNKPNCYWLGMGDYLDAITIKDPRFDSKQIEKRYFKILASDERETCLEDVVQRQLEDLLQFLRPIADKCIGILCGNHEETIRLFFMRDIADVIAWEMKAPYLGYSAFIRLIFRRKTRSKTKGGSVAYDIFATHGFGQARKSGAKINRMEDLCHYFDCDLALIGHEHKKLYTTVTRLGLNSDKRRGELKLEYKKTIGVMTGCFLKGYVENAQNYVEKKGYPPTDLGVAKIYLSGVERNIHVSL